MDTASFFFSFEFDLPMIALRPLSGGAPEVATRLRKKRLRPPSSLCKMSRAFFQMTHRGTTADRAEIGRICGVIVHWLQNGFLESRPDWPPCALPQRDSAGTSRQLDPMRFWARLARLPRCPLSQLFPRSPLQLFGHPNRRPARAATCSASVSAGDLVTVSTRWGARGKGRAGGRDPSRLNIVAEHTGQGESLRFVELSNCLKPVGASAG
jgi:hypothetical protein